MSVTHATRRTRRNTIVRHLLEGRETVSSAALNYGLTENTIYNYMNDAGYFPQRKTVWVKIRKPKEGTE